MIVQIIAKIVIIVVFSIVGGALLLLAAIKATNIHRMSTTVVTNYQFEIGEEVQHKLGPRGIVLYRSIFNSDEMYEVRFVDYHGRLTEVWVMQWELLPDPALVCKTGYKWVLFPHCAFLYTLSNGTECDD